ncbi:hypothetical protein AC249_AIPGENE7954, partial [Exaiptasia diaphana]
SADHGTKRDSRYHKMLVSGGSRNFEGRLAPAYKDSALVEVLREETFPFCGLYYLRFDTFY